MRCSLRQNLYSTVVFFAPVSILLLKDDYMRHLQSFKYVKLIAEIGSIRGAAESCAISPSASLRPNQQIELDLGRSIGDRRWGGES